MTAQWTCDALRNPAAAPGGTAGVTARTGARYLQTLHPTAALWVCGLLALVSAACSSGDRASTPSPDTPSPTREPNTPTASPRSVLADPQFSEERALEHDRVLSIDIGPRPAGSESEKRAAQYLQEQLSSYGYEASLQPFSFDSFVDLGTSLEISSPEARSVQAVAIGASASALAEGSLIAGGLGRRQEIPLGARGSLLLVERGEITFSAKIANAEAAGAIGVIVYNNKAGILNGRLNQTAGIPAAGISQADGQALQTLLTGGPVTVRLETKTETRAATSQNVVVTPPDGSCSIVAGGHYDSVPEGPGANDNASGTAVVLEMARTRAANHAMDGVCYVLFGAEEIGLVGSGEYVRSLMSEQVAGLDAMLNFDMLAVGDEWPFVGSPEITDVAAANADRLGIPHTVQPDLPKNVGSDHINFVDAGVPSIIFYCFCDDHYHSPQDTFEFVLPDRLSQAGEIGLGVIVDLLPP